MGVFGRILLELANGGGDTEEIMIDASRLHGPPGRFALQIACRAMDDTTVPLLARGAQKPRGYKPTLIVTAKINDIAPQA
jgi:hypothetical protein